VDPRTGEFNWVMPDPKADPHGLTVDAKEIKTLAAHY